MANVTWVLGYDSVNGKTWSDVFAPLFINGVVQPAIPTLFHILDGSNKGTFHGNFVVNGSGVIQSGTITGFELYFMSSVGLVLNATGYTIDALAFLQALAALQSNSPAALIDLLYANPMTVQGSVQGEVVQGSDHADSLHGNGGSDKINGLDGDDEILGGDGDDIISGGTGDDEIRGGAGEDYLGGGEGSDTAVYSDESNFVSVALGGPDTVNVLIGGVVTDQLNGIENVTGGSGNDELTGDGLNNNFVGNAGDDRLIGNDGNDRLLGGDGKDKLNGGKGNDEIAGGGGHDSIIGGKHSDTLVFDATLDRRTNVDKVKKFSPAKDTIELDDAVFAALESGAVKGKNFRLGDKAKDGNDHVLYGADGGLRYDPDGEGGTKAVLFTKLKGAPNIEADNIVVA
jgi:Ca2+-binding RTX toxin-like protein